MLPRKTLTATLSALSLSLTALVFASPASAKQLNFNGIWSVRMVTESGSCGLSYNAKIIVQDGQVRSVSGADASVSGGIGSDGSVALGIQRSIARGDASGRLAERSGSGTWRVNMLGCTGRWTAHKYTQTAEF